MRKPGEEEGVGEWESMLLEWEYRLGWACQWVGQWEMGTSACSLEYWWLVARWARTLQAA
ncbi:MAG: hypothetical protein MUO23_13340 [Anaerolineales bacterium]|nr:hypothetical protein [Anaerolineales bacterium]